MAKTKIDVGILKAELILLNSLISGSGAVRRYVIGRIPQESLLYTTAAFAWAIKRLSNGRSINFDLLCLTDSVPSEEKARLMSLPKLPTMEDTAGIVDYAEPIVSAYCRKLLILGTDKLNTKLDSGDIDELTYLEELDILRNKVSSLKSAMDTASSGLGVADTEDKAVDLILKLTTVNAGAVLASGFYGFDKTQGGFMKGELVLLAAPSSHGKTIMGMQICLNMAFKGATLLFYTLELTEDQIWYRIVANIYGIDSRDFRVMTEEIIEKHDLKGKLEDLRKRIKDAGGHIEVIQPQSKLTVGVIAADLDTYHADAYCIDYLGLMIESLDNQASELSNLARNFKLLSVRKNKESVGLLIMQLDEDSGKLRYSRGPKEHCDILMRWSIDTKDDSSIEWHPFDCEVNKSRNGAIFSFPLVAKLKYLRMKDSDSAMQEDKINEGVRQRAMSSSDDLDEVNSESVDMSDL